MFASASLAARIDRAEARLCAGIATTVQGMQPGGRSLVSALSGGQAIYVSPGSPVNKIIGIGLDGPLDIDALEAIEAEWQNRREDVRIELSTLADPTIGPMLSARGYQLHGFENVLGRPLKQEQSADLATSLTIDVIDTEDASGAQLWIDTAVAAFLQQDGTGSVADEFAEGELRRGMTDTAATPGFIRYLARWEKKVAATASLLVQEDGLAQMTGSGTLREFRGRGIQKALIQRRLADAEKAGCDVAVVVTAPGTRSQENMLRRGFQLLYTRAILIRNWPH
jgi:ribosomal protein S18 acetylase RimI-like enzyme